MQNLFLKLLVLVGVIGGSCFVVWKAHEGLQTVLPATNPDQFVALSTPPESAAPDAGLAVALPSAGDPGTLSSSPPAEPLPTLAASPEPNIVPPARMRPVPDSAMAATLPPPAKSAPEFPVFFGASAADSQKRSSSGADQPQAAPSQMESERPDALAAPAGKAEFNDPFQPLPDQKVERPKVIELTSAELPQPEPLADASQPPQQSEIPETSAPPRRTKELFGPAHQPESEPTTATAPAQSQGSENDPAPGLTRLPPSHPGPVLMPVELPPAEATAPRLRAPVITADAVESELEPVQAASGQSPPAAPRPFIPAGMGLPEPAPRPARQLPAAVPPLESPLEVVPTVAPRQSESVVPALGGPNMAPVQTPTEITQDPFGVRPAAADLPPLPPAEAVPTRTRSSGAASTEVLPEVLPERSSPKSGILPGEPTAADAAPKQLPTMPLGREVLPTEVPAVTPFGIPGGPAAPQNMSLEPTPAAILPTPDSAAPAARPSVNAQPEIPGILPGLPAAAATSEPAANQLIGTADLDPSVPAGRQSPELQIEKIAPPEAVVGESLVYAIIIRNVGGSAARDVVVEDRIPRGAQLEGTIPQAFLHEGKLSWNLGTIAPGEERKVQLKVLPIEPGQIGSVATVAFASAVTTSIKITAPQLSIAMEGPAEVVLGEKLTYRYTLRNSGQGVAKSVYLRAILPPELKHPGGSDLEYEVGILPPGGEKIIDLTVLPQSAGVFTPQSTVSNDGKVHAETKADVHVIKSRIELARSGPSARFVGRPAAYTTKVINKSSETLSNVTVQEKVAPGVELAAVPVGGRWDPRARLIIWTLPQLLPGETRELTSHLVASAAGQHPTALAAVDAAGNRAELATVIDVKGFADLAVDVSTPQRTVQVGDQVSLRLTLKNDGTAAARNVRTRFAIPAGLAFAGAHGPVEYQTQGNIVEFASLNELPVNGEQAFDIVLTAAEVGSSKVTVQLETADYEEPLIRDQAIRVIPSGM